ncbi:MAG TPA: Wzz/FepE/Etk N-terminal domain-containing protein [bacterium]|nr:Wzz/FepE/Etk N-terminal domain-containing protein [bacterium]
MAGLKEIRRTLGGNRRWIVRVTLLVTAFSMLLWLVRPTTYRAETTLMPIEEDQGMMGMVSGMLNSSGLGGLMRQIGGNTAVDRLTNMLNSRTLAEMVIDNGQLLPLIHPRKWDKQKNDWKNPKRPPSRQETVKWFRSDAVSVWESEMELLHVTVTWPGTAAKTAEIANLIPQSLEAFINETSVSVARKNREFVGERLDQAKTELTAKEEAFREFQEEHKIYSFDAQAETAMQTVAQLQGQLIAKDVELGMLRRFTTGDNPRVRLLRGEIAELRRQIEKLEGKQPADPSSFFPALADAPTLGVQYLRLKRDLLIAEKVFELLTQQFELAKIDEARRRTLFQVIDRADVPEKRHSPLWWAHLLGGLILGFFGAVGALLGGPAVSKFLRDIRRPNAAKTPDNMEKRNE